MSENKMSEIFKSSIDGIRSFTENDTAIGKPIYTPSGVTVIPVSKVSLGFATGGVDLGTKKVIGNQSFGGGGGSGVSITPIAFLTVTKDSEINLIKLSDGDGTGLERAIGLLEKSPEIIKKIKDTLS